MPSLGPWCKIAISLSETHLAKSVLSFRETTSSFSLPRSLAQVHQCKGHRIAIYCTTDALLQECVAVREQVVPENQQAPKDNEVKEAEI